MPHCTTSIISSINMDLTFRDTRGSSCWRDLLVMDTGGSPAGGREEGMETSPLGRYTRSPAAFWQNYCFLKKSDIYNTFIFNVVLDMVLNESLKDLSLNNRTQTWNRRLIGSCLQTWYYSSSQSQAAFLFFYFVFYIRETKKELS